MCGRFEVKAASAKLKKRFGLKLAPPTPRAGEQRPTQRILTIDAEQGLARGRLLGWGLKVEWDAKPLINARAESLGQKPTFRPLLGRRCLVPATAYFEWQRPEGGAKQKVRIHPANQELFAMAGLVGADGDTVTIVTCTPAPEIEAIHERMPVILAPEIETAWMDPARPFADVQDLLKSYGHGMTAENADDAPTML